MRGDGLLRLWEPFLWWTSSLLHWAVSRCLWHSPAVRDGVSSTSVSSWLWNYCEAQLPDIISICVSYFWFVPHKHRCAKSVSTFLGRGMVLIYSKAGEVNDSLLEEIPNLASDKTLQLKDRPSGLSFFADRLTEILWKTYISLLVSVEHSWVSPRVHPGSHPPYSFGITH